MGSREYGLDAGTVDRLALELVDVQAKGIEIALVIGGGNIYRGMSAAAQGIDRATGDYMGMLATVLNAPRRAGGARAERRRSRASSRRSRCRRWRSRTSAAAPSATSRRAAS